MFIPDPLMTFKKLGAMLFDPPSLIYSQRCFAPCFDISLLSPTQIMLGACFIHCVNKSAFAYLLWA